MGRESLSRGKEKTHLPAIGVARWDQEIWDQAGDPLAGGTQGRWDVLHLHIVHHLQRRLLDLASSFLLLVASVSVGV